MAPLSPLDALGPAFRRAREVLAQPFRLGHFLKIALVAALTQPSFYSATVSYPMQGANAGAMSRMPHPSYSSNFLQGGGLAAAGFAIVLIAIVVAVVVWIAFTYLYCRLRFTLFDLVVFKGGRVRQAWSRYGRQSWRYFGLLLLASLAFLVIAAIIVGPAFVNFFRVVRGIMAAGTKADPLRVLGAMLPFLGAIFLLAAIWAVVDAIMQDFLLPQMAVEDAPLERCFGRFFSLARTQPGSLTIYLLLRFAIGLGITYLLLIVVFLVLLLGGTVIFLAGLGLYHLLWTSLAGQVLLVGLGIITGFVVLVLYLTAIVSIFGLAAVIKQCYAVFYFGGRYPELGDLVEGSLRSTSAEPAHNPPFPPVPPLEDAPPVW